MLTRKTSLVVAAVVVFFAATPPGRDLWTTFFSSLRIAKPQAVSVAVPGAAGPGYSRQLQDLIGPMLADTLSHTQGEPDQPAPDVAAASRLAGFAIALPRTRSDVPVITVLGSRRTTLTVHTDQLRTILKEAGKRDDVPGSLNGAVLDIRTPKAARVQYGHCPQPVAGTIQGQLQGPPPASPDFGDCVVLTEQPLATFTVPAGLAMDTLVDIALQLTGMSPAQTAAFEHAFDWRSSMSMAVPRFVRAWQIVTLGDGPAMMLTTAGRRGPSVIMIWVRGHTVMSLAGYGSSAELIPLANAIQ